MGDIMKILKLIGTNKYIRRVNIYEDEFDGVELTRDITEAIEYNTNVMDSEDSKERDYIADEVLTQYDTYVQVIELL